MKLEWPFLGIQDEKGHSLPYACLQGPVRTAEEAHALDTVIATVPVVGFTSYLSFPVHREADDERDYESICVAWCHCFRQPEIYFKRGKPLLLLSCSDFTNYSIVSPERISGISTTVRDFDFVYVCLPGPWKERVKNWDLAQRCMPILCGELGLRGAIVGRDTVWGLDGFREQISVFGEVPWLHLLRILGRSRFLFVPNLLDASPRIITEALCMNTPVLVNRSILGGWKYVNPFTGAFFESTADVAKGARQCLETWTSPRRWFIANHGPLLAGGRLRKFLANVFPSLRSVNGLNITYTLELGPK